MAVISSCSKCGSVRALLAQRSPEQMSWKEERLTEAQSPAASVSYSICSQYRIENRDTDSHRH